MKEPAAVIRFNAAMTHYNLEIDGEIVARSDLFEGKKELLDIAERNGYTIEIEGDETNV